MPRRTPGKLRLVHQIGVAAHEEQGVDVIVIPGVWNENSPGRMRGSCCWVPPLSESTESDTRVFVFSYRLEIDGTSLWEQLLWQGYALSSGLDESRAHPKQNLRPLLFICHSLGGLILKKFLTLGIRSQQQAHQDATHGIIFLGTPHLRNASAEGWSIVKALMKANEKDISKQNMSDPEKDLIMSTCRSFGDLRLDIPILTVFESMESKFRDKIFTIRMKGSSHPILLTENMVRIDANREVTFSVDKTHADLCNVEESGPLYKKLVEFFKEIITHAPKNMQYTFRQIPKGPPSSVDLPLRRRASSCSMTSSDLPGTKIYTPQTVSSDTGPQTQDLHAQDTAAETLSFEPPHSGGVKFPFSHMSAITRNPRFYGRSEELEEIDKAFGLVDSGDRCEASASAQDASTQEPKTYVLCGMAGIGKTEIASEYLYSRKDRFSAIIWVYSDTKAKLRAEFVELAGELSNDAIPASTDEISAREFVKAWLAAPLGHRMEGGRKTEVEDARWLMVFDNADKPDVLYDWLPSQGPGCILVTAKYPYVQEQAYRLGRGLELDAFTPESGGNMLRNLSGRGRDADAVSASIRISKTLGGHPLAIAQMSAIIREYHLDFKNFEAWYHENAKDLYNQRAGGMWTSYKHTVGTAWALDQLSPEALCLLNVLSILDPDRIPEELLMDGAKDTGLLNYPAQNYVYFKARAELIHASLVTRNMAANEIRIHRLVQEVVRQRLDDAGLQKVFAAVSTLISTVWPYVSGTDPTRNQAWRIPLAERFTPQICRLEELFGSQILSGSFEATATSGFFLSSYAWYISERGWYQQCQKFALIAKRILEIARDKGSGNQERVTHWLCEAHHSLSLAACLTRSSDGIEDANIWQAILLDRINKYGQTSDKLALATAYNQLGICLVNKNRLGDAIDSFQKSISTYKSVENAPQFSGTFPAISLSLLYVLQGQPDEGENVLSPVLEEHERVLGRDDTSTTESGHIWRAMGHIRNGQMEYEAGLDYHDRAVRNLLVTGGDKHFFTGDCFYSLAEDYVRKGDWKKGIDNLDCAITAFMAGPDREAQAARALWKKGRLLRDLGRDTESRESLEKAMNLRKELAPSDEREVEELGDEDWTTLVFYWSR